MPLKEQSLPAPHSGQEFWRRESLAAVVGTPQAQFEALRADGYGEWLFALGDDFVARESAKAYADGLRAYNLAVAWWTRTNLRESANDVMAVNTANLSVQQIESEFAERNAFAFLLAAAHGCNWGLGRRG